MSRSVIAHLFSSVNGVVESPHLWQFGAFGAEEGELMNASIAGVTDIVLGRVLFTEWSQFWPGKDDPFAAWINPTRKHVIAGSLTGELGWNAQLVDGDAVAYVRALKESDTEGGIAVSGGIDTIRSLFLAGLIDRLLLTVHPVVTNEGRRLFDEAVPTTRLHLLDGVTTPAGNVMLTYALLP